MNKKVAFQQVSLTEGRFKILEDINFSLGAHKIIGLIGRNGAGKTSLLSLLASYRLPTSGNVQIDGADAFENDEAMEQVVFIYPFDYAEEDENVRVTLALNKKYYANFDMAYAEDLLQRFDIPLNKAVNKLSRGMQSWLSIAVGLAARAPITIFDEAYLSLDAPAREAFYKEIQREQEKRPRLFILSTHLVQEAEHLFDEVIILDKGRIAFHDDYESFISKGASLMGPYETVKEMAKPYRHWEEQHLGNLVSMTIYGDGVMDLLEGPPHADIEIKPVTLNQLFIHLTEVHGDES